MFKKKNILKHASEDEVFPDIVPAKKNIPEWYKNGTRFELPENDKKIKQIPIKFGFKVCSPFFEALSTGYTIPLPVDIAVMQTEGGPSISYNSSSIFKPISIRDDQQINKTLPIPEGFSNIHFAFLTQNVIKIPKGYSALLTHPLNRYDLPFLTLSGLVDGEFVMQSGNVPVFFNKTFEGIIPAGTPILQVILFKTENWESKVDKTLLEEAHLNSMKSTISSYGWYKNNIWKRKKYD